MADKAPCGFKYPLKTIVQSINLVVFGLSSLRGAKKTFAFFSKCFAGGVPCHVVIQNWVLRYGLYQLEKPVEKRKDWIYVLDHTIEFGSKKCLLVLGLTLETFLENKCRIRHQDVRVLAISVVEKATSASVTEVLRSIYKLTGVPIQIISDGGSNLKRGILDFIAEHKHIIHTYDVTHRAALILKHHLNEDKAWVSFVDHASKTKRSLVHTLLGYLSPPKPKDKSRWLNLDAYVDWAEKILAMDKRKLKEDERGKHKKQLSWLHAFEKNIKEWTSMINLVKALKNEVKSNGFSKNTKENFEKGISDIKIDTPRLRAIKDEIIEYVNMECGTLGNKLVPGCSDIIESILGKYKSFSMKSPMKEVGKTLLTIPVFTSEITPEEVKKAMECVSNKYVNQWLAKTIGETLFVKRKRALNGNKTKNTVKKFPESIAKAVDF